MGTCACRGEGGVTSKMRWLSEVEANPDNAHGTSRTKATAHDDSAEVRNKGLYCARYRVVFPTYVDRLLRL